MNEVKATPMAGANDADVAAVYGVIYSGIWKTDAISFKLLGLVPVVSGGGATILVALLETDVLGPLAIGFLSVLGVITTAAAYRWERRNIQTCERLWARAKQLEKRLGFGRFAGREDPPSLFGLGIGKSEAEGVIYGASLAAWLVPLAVAIANGF